MRWRGSRRTAWSPHRSARPAGTPRPRASSTTWARATRRTGRGTSCPTTPTPWSTAAHTLVRLNLAESIVQHDGGVESYLSTTLPEHVALTCELMRSRITHLVETARFFEHDWLAAEDLSARSASRRRRRNSGCALHSPPEMLTPDTNGAAARMPASTCATRVGRIRLGAKGIELGCGKPGNPSRTGASNARVLADRLASVARPGHDRRVCGVPRTAATALRPLPGPSCSCCRAPTSSGG